MATKKQEQAINVLYNKVKQTNLTQDEVDEINIKGFLYSVSRLNQLQITAFLAILAYEKGISKNEIWEALQ